MLSLVQRLPSKLQFLQISNCPKLMWLPGLQQLLCLRDLKLYECRKLTLLPPEQLPFMHQVRLEIFNCPKLGDWCRRYNPIYNKEVKKVSQLHQFHSESIYFGFLICQKTSIDSFYFRNRSPSTLYLLGAVSRSTHGSRKHLYSSKTCVFWTMMRLFSKQKIGLHFGLPASTFAPVST